MSELDWFVLGTLREELAHNGSDTVTLSTVFAHNRTEGWTMDANPASDTAVFFRLSDKRITHIYWTAVYMVEGTIHHE